MPGFLITCQDLLSPEACRGVLRIGADRYRLQV